MSKKQTEVVSDLKKVICVLRVSTKRQHLEPQKVDMLNYIKSKGFQESEIIWLEGFGASAYKVDVSYLLLKEQLFKTIEETPSVTTVFAFALNRLGRNEEQFFSIKSFLVEHHIQLFIKEPTLYLFNEDGTINEGMELALSLFATLSKQQISELVAKSKRTKKLNKEKGIYCGGNTYIFGKMVSEDKHIVWNENLIPVIQNIYLKYNEGQSIIYIHEYLKTVGIELNRRTVTDIIKREDYKEIVGEEVWNKAQEMMTSKTNIGKNKRKLIGEKKIICPECGSHYVNTKGSWLCLHHSPIYKNTKDYCACNLTVGENILNYAAWDSSLRVYALLTVTNKEKREEDLKRELKDVEKQIEMSKELLDGVEEKLDRLEERYVLGKITDSKRDQLEQAILSEKAKAEDQLRIYEAKQSNIKDTIDLTKKTSMTLLEKFSNIDAISSMDFTKDEKYEICQKVISQIKISRVGDKWKLLEINFINGTKDCYVTKGYGQYGFKMLAYHWQLDLDNTFLDALKNDEGYFPFLAEDITDKYREYLRDNK